MSLTVAGTATDYYRVPLLSTSLGILFAVFNHSYKQRRRQTVHKTHRIRRRLCHTPIMDAVTTYVATLMMTSSIVRRMTAPVVDPVTALY